MIFKRVINKDTYFTFSIRPISSLSVRYLGEQETYNLTKNRAKEHNILSVTTNPGTDVAPLYNFAEATRQLNPCCSCEGNLCSSELLIAPSSSSSSAPSAPWYAYTQYRSRDRAQVSKGLN
jgi:hypothetical protein